MIAAERIPDPDRMTHAMRRVRAALVASTAFSLIAETFSVPVEDFQKPKGRVHARLRYAAWWLATDAGGVPVYGLAKYLGVERKAVSHGLTRLVLVPAGDGGFHAEITGLHAAVARCFPRERP